MTLLILDDLTEGSPRLTNWDLVPPMVDVWPYLPICTHGQEHWPRSHDPAEGDESPASFKIKDANTIPWPIAQFESEVTGVKEERLVRLLSRKHENWMRQRGQEGGFGRASTTCTNMRTVLTRLLSETDPATPIDGASPNLPGNEEVAPTTLGGPRFAIRKRAYSGGGQCDPRGLGSLCNSM